MAEGEETRAAGPAPDRSHDAQPACCDGLRAVPVYLSSVLRLDECVLAGDARLVCLRCGDGHCGLGENVCNCRDDCR